LLGYQPTKIELDAIYENFLIVADEKKRVEDEDLMAIVAQAPILVK
jgi:2-isopropylmalate synthase